jgi:teichuronic acid biosynthesis glycosyltransferase TuaH
MDRPTSSNSDHDVIFVSMENWDEVWRRNQFLCASMARRHPNRKILFVGLSRDVSNSIRRLSFAALAPATYSVPGFANITVTHPVKAMPASIGIGRLFNQFSFRRHVRNVATRMGLRRPVLWLNPHYALHMVGRMGESAVIYDVTDDWSMLSQSPQSRRRVIKQDAALCRAADAVVVCSERLREMKSTLTDKVHRIPNGVDAAHYYAVLDGQGPLPSEAERWPRPVFGYTGTIHPDRIDIDLIEKVARSIKAGSMVLVGPNHLPPACQQRLARCDNVFLHSQIPYSQIPNYMRAFDVCITPHKVTPFTESLNPIKLWEYLAAGKPIVSTDVAGFRDYPGLVYIASDAREFVEKLAAALVEDSLRRTARRTEAGHHSWEARADMVERVIAGCVGRRNGHR